MRVILPVLLLLLLLPLPAAGEEGFGKARAKMLRGLAKKDAGDRSDAVYELDGFDSPEAVRVIVKYVLSRDDRAQVIRAGIDLLGGMREKESLAALAKEAAEGAFPRRARVLESIGRNRSPDLLEALLGAAYDKDPRIRTAALLALENMPEGGRADLALADGLSAPQWPVRSAAAYVLRKRRPKTAVAQLVARLRPGVEHGRLLGDVHGALTKITGKRFGLSYEVWKRWLDQQEGKEPEGEIPASPPRSVTAEMPRVRSYAKRILYVLAVHQSMNDAIIVDPTEVAPKDVRQKGGSTLEAWTSAKKKIELARLWVAWSIDHLAPEVRFNVVTYASSPNAVFKDFVPASRENRERAVRRISSLSASGEANLHAGLQKVFTLVSRHPLDEKSLEEGPEVVFFVSDGYVETGEIREGHRVFEEAERLNIYRQIRFHCFGMGGHDSRVLGEMSGMVPGGRHVSLP
ncbi:MAG: VWA domain-containing protein [Planctomycetota bacterium]|jgi:hypothetical protein